VRANAHNPAALKRAQNTCNSFLCDLMTLALFCCEANTVESKAVKKKTADLGSRGQSSTIALAALILEIARSNPTCSIHKLYSGVFMFLRVPLCHVNSGEQGLLHGCHFNQLKTEISIRYT
jgi:hypothetical protein